MPRYYRNQFAAWQPESQVFQVRPDDLSTINAMSNFSGAARKASQSDVERFASERVNTMLWMLTCGGVR